MTFRTYGLLALTLFSLCGVASQSHATTIDFEGLDGTSFIAVPAGYAGLDWNNIYSVDSATYPVNPSGFQAGTTSGTGVAYTGYSGPASIVSTTPFNFFGGNFTSAWNNGEIVTLTGSENGVAKYTDSFVINADAPAVQSFTWTGIDTISLAGLGGVNQGFGGSGEQIVLDDLVVGSGAAVSAVPLPPTATLFLAALMALGSFAWMRRRALGSV